MKRAIEQVLIYPLILLGKIIGLLSPLKGKGSIFLFFPSDGIGGATKVNADIVKLLQQYCPTIIFSKKYSSHALASQFIFPNVKIIDLRGKVDNKKLYFINIVYRGIISSWINRVKDPVVFGGESIYFYKVLPFLKKEVKVIELLHVNTWLNYNQAFVKYIDQRLTSTAKVKRDIEDQYRKNDIPKKYLAKLDFIDNWVDIPNYKEYQFKKELKVLFVGRGSPQKRIHLLSEIAEKVMRHTDDIKFTFVGDVKPLLSDYVVNHSDVYEHVNDKDILAKIYDQSDVLILTSAFEGLPIVVMEMMARGKVVLSTAVDAIPDYVIHQKTGLLIHEVKDEEKLVIEACQLLYELNGDRIQLKEIGKRAYSFAQKYFQKDTFETKYKVIFQSPKM